MEATSTCSSSALDGATVQAVLAALLPVFQVPQDVQTIEQLIYDMNKSLGTLRCGYKFVSGYDEDRDYCVGVMRLQ